MFIFLNAIIEEKTCRIILNTSNISYIDLHECVIYLNSGINFKLNLNDFNQLKKILKVETLF